MPFRGFANLFGFKNRKDKKAKNERKHPYDEVDESQLQANKSSPKRRPREYDEIEIDDDASGPSLVDDSSAKPEPKTLNYIEVEVQPQSPDAEVRRSEPATQYTTIDVSSSTTSGERKVSISK